MQNTPDLRVLFPTTFSDSGFRTSRAIAQLADMCDVSLTIAHVAKPGTANRQMRRELNSFMAEADNYHDCRRVLVESHDPVEAIGDLCDKGSFDLVMAPASDRFGLHRLLTTSFRARLLERCKVPVWTAGRCLDRVGLKHSIRSVACLLDFDCPTDTHLQLAASLAWRTGASLRIVTVIEPVNEGTLAHSLHSQAPLMPTVAMEKIRSAFIGRVCPEIDVAVGETSKELPWMLRRCDADVIFVGQGQALNGIWSPKLAAWLDRLPCPAVCVDGASAQFNNWTFEHKFDAREIHTATPSRARAMAV